MGVGIPSAAAPLPLLLPRRGGGPPWVMGPLERRVRLLVETSSALPEAALRRRRGQVLHNTSYLPEGLRPCPLCCASCAQLEFRHGR